MKVFSKKKAADRTQHNLRTFSVPLRPSPSPPSSSILPAPAEAEAATSGNPGGGTGGGGGGAGAGTPDPGNPIVKITVPANLPVDAADVVERLKCSVMAFKQVWAGATLRGRSWRCASCVVPGRARGSCYHAADSAGGHPSLPAPRT